MVEAQAEVVADEPPPDPDATAQAAADKSARLKDLGASLSVKRKEAILYRRSTGIEQEWDEDEDAYEGVDELSKADKTAYRTRPVGQVMVQAEGDDQVRSTVVLNITKPYVNAFASKIIDMRLQMNDRSWAFRPTPKPELAAMAKSQLQVVQGGRQVPAADIAKKTMAAAVEAATRAQEQVDDWMIEAEWDSEARQALDDMARIGTGVLKGPYPEKCTYYQLQNGKVEKITKIKPRSKRISARNLYPDPACGEDVHNGDWIWEQDDATAKRLKELIGLPGYLQDQIEEVLKEGPRLPEVEHDPNKAVDPTQKNKPFQIWYYTGTLNKDDIEAAGCTCEVDELESIPVIVTMVNDHVIRASRNPLDNGSFPYDVAPCSRREGYWAGIGIGRELRTPQRIVTGAVRAMMENAGLSAKPILAIMQKLLVPSDGNYSLYGGKTFIIPTGTDIQEAKNAIFSFQIESRQEECMNIIQFGLGVAEKVTGLPMILQGQMGKAPDVLGVVRILDDNASSVARRVAKMYDDNMLGPHVHRYYDWLMQYSTDPTMQGDYTIDVLPSPDAQADQKALVELGKAGQMPGSRVDPARLFKEMAKSMRFDPARIQYSDEEWAKIQRQPQPGDPRVEAAKIKAEADLKYEQLHQQFEATESAKDRQLQLLVEQVDERIQAMKLQGAREISFDELRAMLAETAMKLNVQKDLSLGQHMVELHTHHHPPPVITPPTEPVGRAQPGQAYAH